MAALPSFREAEAGALPLSVETVGAVVGRARWVCLAQLAGFGGLSLGFGWLAFRTDGTAAGVPAGVAALSLWGVLGASLSLWDHLRVSRALGRLTPGDLAGETDARNFWWKHRGVFPMRWENR